MKWLVLLVLLFLLFVFITTRYRKQINAAIYLWKSLQNPSEEKTEKKFENREDLKEVSLVKCADCGTWIPQKTALNIKSEIFFCSKKCGMQTSVRK
jgi:Ca2+/Na+ antiporter